MARVEQGKVIILEGRSPQLLLEWLTFHKEFGVDGVEIIRLPHAPVNGPAKEFSFELMQYKEGFGWGHADRVAVEDLAHYINNS